MWKFFEENNNKKHSFYIIMQDSKDQQQKNKNSTRLGTDLYYHCILFTNDCVKRVNLHLRTRKEQLHNIKKAQQVKHGRNRNSMSAADIIKYRTEGIFEWSTKREKKITVQNIKVYFTVKVPEGQR